MGEWPKARPISEMPEAGYVLVDSMFGFHVVDCEQQIDRGGQKEWFNGDAYIPATRWWPLPPSKERPE